MKLDSIVFFILLTFVSHPSVKVEAENHRETPCQRSLAIPLPHEEIHRFENDSLLHEGVLYPPHLYWHDENSTYGCTCELRYCVRKCCQNGQVLSDGKTPICKSTNVAIPELAPGQHQLVEEIKNISKISERFGLVKNRICPSIAYKLEPELYDEDNFVLQANGTLKTVAGDHYEQSRYCMDLHEDLVTITILVCHEPVPEPITAETTIYPIGIVISIPFLLATFVVYAIIPELKNLYGMTLMCYVACLIAAYCFLTGGRLVYHGQPLCIAIDGKDCPAEASIASKLNKSETETVLECPCIERLCLPLCCPIGSLMIKHDCTPVKNISALEFPPHHDPRTLEKRPEQLSIHDFHVFSWNPCQDDDDRYQLEPEENPDDEYKLLANGSIYLPVFDKTIDFTNYCFGAIDNTSVYIIVLCFNDYFDDNTAATVETKITVALPVGMILSVPFLLVTFVVYSVIPELRNMHGATLRGYIGPLIVAYINLAIVQITPNHKINDSVCTFLAFVIHFSFLASFFWLNVMCFDIWWTFGGFRSLQGSVKQRERKKFIIYSVYAWGSASLITGVCLIMDFVPSVPRNFIRPEFGVGSCWFNTDAARAIYFYGPMGVTVACNICLFISTAIKIIQHKKDTAHHLKGMDSRRHDDNKQWFNLYLKLFIVMGINWSMEIISWLCKDSPQYVWYITDLANTLQGVIIFVIFVWKDKIKRLLQKRLGCQNRSFRSRNSTKSAYHSSASRTCTTTAVTAPLQEKSNPYSERTKITTDESDCV